MKEPDFLLVLGFLNEGFEPSFFLVSAEEADLLLVLDLLLKVPALSEVVGVLGSFFAVDLFVLCEVEDCEL